MNLLKLRCTDKEYEVYHNKYWLFCFGSLDLRVEPDCNINNYSCSSLGNFYESPSANEDYALAGSD